MSEVRVSVIMAEYNTPTKYLDDAIRSILYQSFKDFEFIIIDDCGTNNMIEFVKKYNDPRIKVFRNNKNMGLVFSLNKAIDKSRGNYLVRMDGDDLSVPNRLEILYEYISNHPEYSVVGSRAMEFFDSTDIGILGKTGEKDMRSIMRGDIIIHASAIMNKKSIQSIGGYKDYTRAEDLVLWCELLLSGHKLITIEHELYWYRVNPSDYNKRKLVKRKGEILARLKYYPRMGANIVDYAYIVKSIMSGILPTRLVSFYRATFVLEPNQDHIDVTLPGIPQVTIIIPVYNLEKYIESTLDSVFAQTIKNFHLIVVNDGSTDTTLKLLKQYSNTNSNLTIVNKRNGGVSSARNAGIRRINTKYYTFVDGDDILHPDYLSRLLHAIQITNADVAISSSVKNNYEMKTSNKEVQVLKGIEACEELLYGKSIKNSPFGKIYRSSLLNDLRFREEISIGEDMEYVFNCLTRSEKVAITKDKLYTYVQRSGSAMNQPFNEKRADSYKAALMIYENNKSTTLAPAASSKLFIEALSVAALAHDNAATNNKIYNDCLKTMRSLAKKVVKDKNARFRHRIYAALTTINPVIPISILNIKSRITR